MIAPIDDGEGVEIFKSRDNLGGIEEGRCCRKVARPVIMKISMMMITIHNDGHDDDQQNGK